ncbi:MULTISPECIES: hypothetical protein [Sphingobium]|uniref:Lipoprotein n=1 Tax=Sphingobium chungbukense TaxID=56193 RepID=A0A0M3AVE0_9SPHN|nr:MULTISPECIES: hypothetical protein [Sphingobium]KKW92544.1 hypothetical protein YP76_06250 [Sphingobium chungbukense]PJG49404.1 hypothetical protein CAF53_15145 [Sphingobium sp. LB126]
MRLTSLCALFLLAACQREAASPERHETGVQTSSGLERAAIETGVIADAAKIPAIGLYQRTHEAGRDALCVIPAKNGDYRFGLEATFGEDQSCVGRGSARRAGDKLILSFSRSDHCIVVAQYDGDQISLPGVVDMKCADVCKGRGTLEGVSFPRVTSDVASALQLRDSSGGPLCQAD